MINFLKWLKLNESMSLYIDGYDFSDDIKDFDDIAHYIKKKLIYPVIAKLPHQDQEIINKTAHYHGILTPDGSHYMDNSQVLNFYTQGWKDVPKILQGIKYYLDELKIKYGPFKEEKSGVFDGNVIRIPILSFNPTQNAPPDLNLSNANAQLIFHDLLGFNIDDHISAADLYRRIEMLDQNKLNIHARDAYTSKTSTGPTMIHGGLSDKDIANRLQQIKNIAKWAVDNHYDQMYLA